MITDAQIHLWAAESAARPWPSGHLTPHRPWPMAAEEAVAYMDAAGVDRAVIVPPTWEGNRNDVALRAVKDYPGRFAVMGRIDVADRSGVDLGQWLAQPGMLGVRLLHPGLFEDDVAAWFWPVLEQEGIPVMAYGPGKADGIGAVAEAFPHLVLVLDHLNIHWAPLKVEIGLGITDLLQLARYPNIALKISGIPSRAKESYPFPSLPPILERVLEAFGAGRCMWGSDLSDLQCDYSDWVRTFTEADFLSESDKKLIMGGSLSRWLNWPESA